MTHSRHAGLRAALHICFGRERGSRRSREVAMNTSLFGTAILGSMLIVALPPGDVQARGAFKVLHHFAGGSSDGAGPFGGVAPAGGGSFYVATDGGGSSNRGTLSLLHKNGTIQILH